ncbi:MAG: hypothetical protein AAFV45_06085 [Pseudomonadota bacterium]
MQRKPTHRTQLYITPQATGACANGFLHTPDTAEELVGLGFRHWMRGCQTGDVDHWAKAWTLYSNRLGPTRAKTVMGELSGWVQLVSCRARRSIEVAPEDCAQFCRDECLAVSMIAAAQHKTCPAMRACTFALLEDSMIEEVVDRSDRFALMLRASDQVLSQNAIFAGDLSGLTPVSGTYQ